MKFINKIKAKLIHMLGGYTKDESIHRSKIKRVRMTHRYTTDLLRMREEDLHAREHSKALYKFASGLSDYIDVQQNRDLDAHEWCIYMQLLLIEK